jgi:HEAT repeat protein
MFHFTPITAALLAAALQASTAGPGATVAADAEHLTRALAEWELYAATSGADAEVAAALETLAAKASAAKAGDPADAALARAAEAVAAARTRFRTERGLDQQPAAQRPGQEPRDPRASDEEVIAMAILNHLHAEPSKEHKDAILRFGARAVPALVSSARSMSAANALGAPLVALDTLSMIDPLKALEVSWELSAQPSFLVRQAIATVLSPRMVLTHDEVWIARGEGDHVPADPRWGQLVERLLLEPALPPKDLRNVLAACAMRGYAPQVVIDAILSIDDLEYWPQLGYVPPGTRPLFIEGLRHPSWYVRRSCAQQVSRFPDATPLFALHSDESKEVRQVVAGALGERDVALSTPTQGSVKHTKVPAVPGPEHRAALERCLSDEELSVSQLAASAVERAHLGLNLSLLPPADLARLATTVKFVEVKLALLRLLVRSAPNLVPGVVEPTLSDPALRATEKTYSDAYHMLFSGSATGDDARAIATAVLTALEAHASPREWGTGWGPGQSQPPALLVYLPEELRVRLARSLARHNGSAAWHLGRWWNSVPHDPSPWRTLVLDTSASLVERAVALEWSLGETAPSAEHATAIVDVVKAVARERAAPEGGQVGPMALTFLSWVNGIAKELALRNGAPAEVPRALFADRSVPDSVLLELGLGTNGWSDEDRAAFVRAVLERFPVNSWEQYGRQSVFNGVVDLAHTLQPVERVPLIEGALRLQNESMRNSALGAASRCRDIELIEVLRRFAQSADPLYLPLPKVASTAASFLSDDAAKFILELAALAPLSEWRASILESLQQVTDYQSALANWQQRNDASAVRVRAIADLVALIDDTRVPEAQRAEALRGLGLLGAVEELPRLVRTLSATSDALRTAAREALDRLNAAPVK